MNGKVYTGVCDILRVVLGCGQLQFSATSPLLGSVPEFDSMAVVNVIAALEERFGIFFEDDEVTAEMFETVGSLCEAVERKLSEG